MGASTIISLLIIGLLAGVISGFIGIGGGIVIVPALVFFLGLTQHEAQGTSLAMMLPPIGILAVYNYYRHGHLSGTMLWYAGILAVSFIIGGFLGSRIAVELSPVLVKKIFGIVLFAVAIKLVFFPK